MCLTKLFHCFFVSAVFFFFSHSILSLLLFFSWYYRPLPPFKHTTLYPRLGSFSWQFCNVLIRMCKLACTVPSISTNSATAAGSKATQQIAPEDAIFFKFFRLYSVGFLYYSFFTEILLSSRTCLQGHSLGWVDMGHIGTLKISMTCLRYCPRQFSCCKQKCKLSAKSYTV